MRILTDYHWPGNVRELENVLERALVLSRGRPISELLLSRELAPVGAQEQPGDHPAPAVPGSTFAEIERHAIMTTYESCGRSPQRTAQILGLSPRTIHYRLREYSGKSGAAAVGRLHAVRDAPCRPCADSVRGGPQLRADRWARALHNMKSMGKTHPHHRRGRASSARIWRTSCCGAGHGVRAYDNLVAAGPRPGRADGPTIWRRGRADGR